MIPKETIEAIRERTDIVAVISETVPSLKKRGRSFVGLCPFHSEKTPSFHVSPERGYYHCFGCKESGSAIDFVMKIDGMSFPEAVRALGDRAGVVVEDDRKGAFEQDRRKSVRDSLAEIMNLAATFYERQLREHSERHYPLAELEKRGIVPSWVRGPTETSNASGIDTIDDALQAFRIGYAPHGWDHLASYLRGHGVSMELAEQAGLVARRSSGDGHYDRFRHRLMFAVMDVMGRVVAFSGRALEPVRPEPDRGPPPKYVNSPESELYTKGDHLFGLFQGRHAIRTTEEAIVVEGNFDVFSLHARGVTNVVAPLGTALTDAQSKLLKRFASKVVLLFDGDAAGAKAAAAARAPLRRAGIKARWGKLAEGEDPDDLVRSRGTEALTAIVEGAGGLFEILLEQELEGLAGLGAEETRERLGTITRLINEEDDPIVRSLIKAQIDRLIGRLNLADSPETCAALDAWMRRELGLAREGRAQAARTATAPRPRRPVAPGSRQRAAIVGALVEYPELAADPACADALALLSDVSALTAAAIARAWRPAQPGERPTLDVDTLIDHVPADARAFVQRRLAAPEHDTLEQATTAMLKNAEALLRIVRREEREAAKERGARAGDWDEEKAIYEELVASVRAKRPDLKSS